MQQNFNPCKVLGVTIRWPFNIGLGIVLVMAIVTMTVADDSCDNRIRKLNQLIDAAANKNDEPKVVEIGDVGIAITLFSEKYDWAEQKRVQAAVWTLSQEEEDSDELWRQLTKHFDDKRFSSIFGEQHCWAEIWLVGDICREMAHSQLLCAYLQHLQPGKTAPMGGDSHNSVSDDQKEFLPQKLQLKLHNPPQLGEWTRPEPNMPDTFKNWCHSQKNKSLYRLQIEMCQWAITTVEKSDCAETPKKNFIQAVNKQIETLKETKKPVIDRSAYASPIWRARIYPFDANDAKNGWEEYREAQAEEKGIKKKREGRKEEGRRKGF